jgi:phage replication initiation protein
METPSAFDSSISLEADAIGTPARMDAPASAGMVCQGMQTHATDGSAMAVEVEAPRLVIRGENLPKEEIRKHSQQPNIASAFIDYLNFSFPYVWEAGKGLGALDQMFLKAFGFGFSYNRGRKHLNYEQSWALGDDYGIFATGGNSVGGTSFVTLPGQGCMAVKNWTAVYYLLIDLKAKITRIDLAHDDFLGQHDVLLAKAWWEEGRFNPKHGRPAEGKFVDDMESGKGKTFYVGNRKSGKLLRVYEKGKQLGDPYSPWVRWECELHNVDRVIRPEVLISPGTHLAGSYPCMGWIYPRQSRIETTRKMAEISVDVMVESCKRSYGKLLWFLRGIGWSDTEIIDKLAREGFPKRLDMPVPDMDEV